MAKRYEPKVIEPKWQAQWAKDKTYEVTEDTSKQKIYASPMLPYPSGTGLHTGHVRNYSITDAVARFYRQKGFNTMSNIAWDSFGLPAENFAIKTGTPPAESTAKNIAYFKEQLQKLGMSYAWEREFNTSDPSYYKWTQWVFSQLYNRGLAYQAEKMQWWCESCKTVLADEQVIAGKCWRHDGADDPIVKKRNVTQWFFKITDYVDRILDNTDSLDWPEKIKTMQKNWIGKSKGAEVIFEIEDRSTKIEGIKVFTTRPDTLFGVTFLVLAPEHELVSKLTTADKISEVESYVSEASKKDEIERQSQKEKTGVFTGAYAINPISGEKLPIWIADYVLAGYGTGAIMAVPAHDERDSEFAKKYDLPIIRVVEPVLVQTEGTAAFRENEPAQDSDGIIAIVKHWSEDKYIGLKWPGPGWGTLLTGGIDEGFTAEQTALKEITEETGYKNAKIVQNLGVIHSKYYHEPKNINRFGHAPAFYVELENDERAEVDASEHAKHEVVWLTKAEMNKFLTATSHQKAMDLLENPVFSDEGLIANSGEYSGMSSSDAREKIVADLEAKGVGAEKTTYKIRDWLISRQRYWGAPVPIIHCPDHGAVLVPEKDLPVVLPHVENYAPDGTNHSVLAGVEEWVNAPCPTCGKPSKRETDIMDGYVCSTWYLYRYADAHNENAAFDPRKVDYWFPLDFYFGADHAVAHLLYIRFLNLVMVDMGLMSEDKKEPVKKLVFNGYINAEDGSKMSKSKGNTVDPMDIINSGYGADALRVFELFIAPYDQDTSWNTNGVPGTYRFLQRVWNVVSEYVEASSTEPSNDNEVLAVAHATVKKVTSDLEHLNFNTAVSAMMQLTNELFLLKAKCPVTRSDAWKYAIESLIQLLAPFAPHISEEMWHDVGHSDTVHIGHWPEWDESYLVKSEVTYAVQVNGKIRGEVTMPVDSHQVSVEAVAKSNEKVAGYITSDPIKVIFVPNKLISFVVR